MRCLGVAVLVLGFALLGHAQDEGGWDFSGRLSGNAYSSGVVLKVDPSVGYTFNKNFQAYAGLPLYIVRDSGASMNGVGNAYLGFRIDADTDAFLYSTNLDFSVPTGDKDRGFSTGRVTVDWTNNFSRTFSSVTPFASIGIGNTVSDTPFFVRPFSSYGLVGHFDAGATYDITDVFRIAGSAYSVLASGEQRIISRVVPRNPTIAATLRERLAARNPIFAIPTETLVPASSASDHGFSAWFDVSPRPDFDFHVGYNRSVGYDLNSLFFGIGFRVGK